MSSRKLLTIVSNDKKLTALFSGIIACMITIISITVIAGKWLLI